ncbi:MULTISPECIES: DUF723 domain-containing protein [Vibrio]|uniref:DUF723 domain-containing protein n=1 Tax=Vibrio TaxID=662 RepID=UPI0004DD174C|nr:MULTISPECIES: DUF723 domain-containing protein [Vibrio]KFA94884.1 hypothetical protein HW45_28985 [Vibrio sp. ER1A]MCG9660741.1 DUF723 domain-containing protein [Vibrio mediterranei]
MTSKEERATQFLANAKEKFGELYDYSKVNYENNRTHVTITCPIHGNFQVSPANFLTREIGCPHCRRQASRQKRQENYSKKRAKEGCTTNQFNVRGYQTKHSDLLKLIFD